jgi:hypothetical protein
MTLGDVDGTFVLLERTGTPQEAEGTLVVVVPGTVDNEGIRERAQETSNRVPWDKVLAEAAQRAPAAAQSPPSAAGTRRSAAEEPGREPFPWEDDPAPGAVPPSRKSGSWGKRRRSATDSSQGPTPGPTPRPAQQEGTTGPGEHPDAPDDDGLPPLPDFLKED